MKFYIKTVILILGFSLFQPVHFSRSEGIGPGRLNLCLVSSEQARFRNYVSAFASGLSSCGLREEALENALKGYLSLKERNRIRRDSILAIVDFSMSSNEERLYILHVPQKKLILKTYTAHGIRSGSEFAGVFSNKQGSNMSSYGIFLTGESYEGKRGLSLKLEGLEPVNSNVMLRGVVVHGAGYVSEKFAKMNTRLGRSNGCFAVPEDENETIVNLLKGGAYFFAYFPDSAYLQTSEYLQPNCFLRYFSLH